jgi:UDP-N-acetylglucosamine 2-epimerase (non-hydrolysing)
MIPAKLESILHAIMDATADVPVIFPVHPRTRQILNNLDIDHKRLIMIDPLGYLEFIYLVKYAKGIITDSGGITEEATVLQVPCLTLRNSTERPETVTIGTNELIGDDLPKLKLYLGKIMEGNWKKGSIPEFWDGKTSERIVKSLLSIYAENLKLDKKANLS